MATIEPTDATLKMTEKNRIWELVAKYGPPPSQFAWTEAQHYGYLDRSGGVYKVSILTHLPSGYYCIFGGLTIRTSPGTKRKVDESHHDDRWEYKQNMCGRWLLDVLSEAEAPDLWASIIDEKSLSTAASATVDNQPFTAVEQHFIATTLDEIKGHILEGQQFATEQADFINREFAYFKESSTRLGRKDWLSILYGGLITVIVGVALAPDAARSLLRLAAAAFQSLWGMAPGQLP